MCLHSVHLVVGSNACHWTLLELQHSCFSPANLSINTMTGIDSIPSTSQCLSLAASVCSSTFHVTLLQFHSSMTSFCCFYFRSRTDDCARHILHQKREAVPSWWILRSQIVNTLQIISQQGLTNHAARMHREELHQSVAQKLKQLEWSSIRLLKALNSKSNSAIQLHLWTHCKPCNGLVWLQVT